jgi:hypothetical protein
MLVRRFDARPRTPKRFDPQTEIRIQREKGMFSYRGIRRTGVADGIESADS